MLASTTIRVMSEGCIGGLQHICKLGFVLGGLLILWLYRGLVLSSNLVIFVSC
jgi:hypothetical protein